LSHSSLSIDLFLSLSSLIILLFTFCLPPSYLLHLQVFLPTHTSSVPLDSQEH
jgi:hypothetical protein